MRDYLITFDHLPESVEVCGMRYPIGYGYRTMMAIEIEMFGDNNDEQKMLNALNLFYLNNIPPDTSQAIDALMWFYRCGRERRSAPGSSARPKRGYCFVQDAPLLYAAFRQQYGIDLRRTRSLDLHWWEFLALFESLSEDTKMAKVMYWRTCDTKGMGKEQKAFISSMRSLYALNEPIQTMDSKARLAKRNADMKAYVKKRVEECRSG